MAEQPFEDLLARLERERQDADRFYNDALTAVDRAIQVTPGLPETPRPFDTTRVPNINSGWDILDGGASSIDRSLKGRLRALVWRLIGPPLEIQRQFNAAVVDHINRNVAAHHEIRQTIAVLLEAVRGEFEALVRFESLLVQYLQTITSYIDTKDRSLGGRELRERLALAEQRVMALKREMEERSTSRSGSASALAPASREAFAGNVDSTTYVGFEDRFRGARDDIRGHVGDYISLLASASDVVDVGCGRGELLELLGDRGISARGVDANEAMTELCRARGLDVAHADALAYLESQPDGAIGALVAIQVVEHFEPGYLARFLETAFHKMRPGAPLILETINAACWMAFFECYLRDLTHQRALHPDTLRYLVEASGFASVDVQFRQPVADTDRLDRVALSGSASTDAENTPLNRVASALNAHADKLNARMFSSMDYVVIARR